MVDLLVVAATIQEVFPLMDELNIRQDNGWPGTVLTTPNLPVTVLITGIGMTHCALHLGHQIAKNRPQEIIQVGIAGAFEHTGIEIGEVVEVGENILADCGAETPTRFLDLEELGFPTFKNQTETLYNRYINDQKPINGIQRVKEITVNKVHGADKSIHNAIAKWQPQTESMEGAAVFAAGKAFSIPFREFRGISNLVVPRNKDAWEIPKAIQAVNSTAIAYIKQKLA